MLLSDFGVILASLGLSSSPFKPSPIGTIEVAMSPLILDKTASVLGNLAPESSPLGSLERVDQNSISNLAVSIPPSTAAESHGSPNISAMSRPSIMAMGDACAVGSYSSPTVLTQKFPPFDEARAIVYRYRKQQGVNLGSWFVHEQWMTPSLFDCAAGKRSSELDIASGWGSPAAARAVLERHWDTFITADDFAHLASIGINTVRIPIGYWSLGPAYCQQTPFEPVSAVYQNAWAHIVRAINMASDVGIGVLIDLHGAVGSQNGQPHSGISDGQTNLFTNPEYQEKTIQVLTFLTQQLSPVTNVVGIQILNEPQNDPQLADFYTRALTILRQVSPEAQKLPFYIHDGFDLQRFHDYVSARTDFVVQDHHSYFVFTPKDDAESADDHANDINGSITESLNEASQGQRNNIVIGEWSCALTADSLAKEQDPESARRRFCESQMQAYQKATAGWDFWSYAKDGCDGDGGWCFKRAVGRYLPPSFFSYPRGSSGSGIPGPAVASALAQMQLPHLSTILQSVAQVTGPTALDSFPENVLADTTAAAPSYYLTKREHRFVTLHNRRQTQSTFISADALSPPQRAAVKGYTDGFLTAKIFATYGLSRLGFVGQYIVDNLRALGTVVVEPGNENYYRGGFMKGLADGEDVVSRALTTA